MNCGSLKTYLQLEKKVEMLQDVRDYDRIKAAIESGEEALIPSEVVYAILDGANPIKAWRQHRGLTQQTLSGAAEISVPYLSQLESGKRKGSVDVLTAIAEALQIPLDELVP